MYRCVIWAAVSTKPQAAAEKDSIPTQIARAREVIEARGWIEAHDPLIVPGQTRSYRWLHDAVREIPQLENLLELARQGKVDLVICRDYDRLARTSHLLSDITTYLRDCRCQIYALDKATEPLPPQQLGKRHATGTAYVQALAGVEAEHEVSRIVQRHYWGFQRLMRDGRWKHSAPPYGYTREVRAGEKTIFQDVPLVVPEEVAVIRKIERLYLDEGMGSARLAKRLNAEGIPTRHNARWVRSSILNALKNEFYCGWIIWGLTRVQRVFDPDQGALVKRQVKVPSYERLWATLGHQPTLFDVLDHEEELVADDVIIAEGMHEAIRTVERQREIYAEIARRRELTGRAASTDHELVHLFGGLLKCAECGRTFGSAGTKPAYPHLRYYRCTGKNSGVPCGNGTYIREDALYDKIIGLLTQIARQPDSIEEHIQERAQGNLDTLRREVAQLDEALEAASARKRRWDDAYEGEVITLAQYSERLSSVEDLRADLEMQRQGLGQRLRRLESQSDGRDRLRERLMRGPIQDTRARIKLWLRRVIQYIVIQDGEVVELYLRVP